MLKGVVVLAPYKISCLEMQNTPDEDFILDTHPYWNNIIIGAGFSGMKHNHSVPRAPVREVSSHLYLFTYWFLKYEKYNVFTQFRQFSLNVALWQWRNLVKCIVLCVLNQQVNDETSHTGALGTQWQHCCPGGGGGFDSSNADVLQVGNLRL